MKCKVDGCGRDATYKGHQVCQKHYFRMWRNGTTDIVRSRKERTENAKGYQKLSAPGHRLVNSDGYAYEHRLVVYAKYGENLPDCELCGKPTDWATCHIDHKDNDVKNNDISNLRPVCRPCNTNRGRKQEHLYSHHTSITVGGLTMTAHEWAKFPGVLVTGSTIRRRLSCGASHYDAVYGKKITHNGNKKKGAA